MSRKGEILKGREKKIRLRSRIQTCAVLQTVFVQYLLACPPHLRIKQAARGLKQLCQNRASPPWSKLAKLRSVNWQQGLATVNVVHRLLGGLTIPINSPANQMPSSDLKIFNFFFKNTPANQMPAFDLKTCHLSFRLESASPAIIFF